MGAFTEKELKKIIDNHKKWLEGLNTGICANLSNADLRNANLSHVNLRNANLSGVDLRNTDLNYADLSNADLRNANLSYANSSYAYLRNANLSGADLSYANLINAHLNYANLRNANLRNANLINTDLSYAYLRNADLSNVDLSYANLINAYLRNADLNYVNYNYLSTGLNISCPEIGSFTAFKKAADGVIVVLLITEDAKRSSATTRKCRASKAKVISIDNGLTEIASKWDSNFIYKLGETVEVKDFDEDRWNECSTGIHFFMTRKEAEEW